MEGKRKEEKGKEKDKLPHLSHQYYKAQFKHYYCILGFELSNVNITSINIINNIKYLNIKQTSNIFPVYKI